MHDVTLFVGAGISVPSGAPDFRRLRDRFLTPLVGDKARGIDVDQLSPEQIFDALDDGQDRTHEAIRAEMWWECEAREPGANHYAVAALAAAGARVWTTNFDTLLERAAERLGIPWHVVTPEQSPADVDALMTRGHLVLIKPHGSFPFGGDPPREPVRHDYPLLFRASDVWRQLDGAWAALLRAHIAGRDVRLFGYRGADLDIVPVFIDAFPHARRIEWWEVAAARENIARLRARFAGQIELRTGDPSAALQDLAQGCLDGRRIPPPRAPLARPAATSRYESHCSWTTRAAVQGQFEGAATARRTLARAVLSDPWALKRTAAWRLVRSAGFDDARVGAVVTAALRTATSIPGLVRRDRTWVLYATLVDALPLRASDALDLARLGASPMRADPEILVRIASKEKRMGELASAAAHARAALDTLRERRAARPALEAMIVYNLAWTLRQQWDIPARSGLVDAYKERMAHIGFNWAAWLQLDDALLALNRGEVAEALERLDEPFLRYARELIRHSGFLADEQLAQVLARWSGEGPVGIDVQLDALLARDPLERRWPTFNAVNLETLLADQQRAAGRRAGMERHLTRLRSRALSPLQRARVELVSAVADKDVAALRALAGGTGLGLVAESARAVLGASTALAYRREAPLAGLY